MKFSIGMVGDFGPDQTVELARFAERRGLDQVWVADERFYRDVYASMTLLACRTERIRIGAMVTDPFVRHPALTATAAASVDEISGGRCVLGMGAGVSGFAAMGIERIRPARAIKEAIALINRLCDGEQDVKYEGEIIRFDGGHLGFEPLRRVPIFVAGRGPRVLQAGGEMADGVVVASYASEEGIRWGIDHVAKGAARGGRSLEDIELMSWLYTSVSDDGDRARDSVRTGVAVAMWGSREILAKIGVTLPDDVLRFMDEHSYGHAPGLTGTLGRMLPDELLGQFSLAGTPAEVTERLIRIARMASGTPPSGSSPPRGSRSTRCSSACWRRSSPRCAPPSSDPRRPRFSHLVRAPCSRRASPAAPADLLPPEAYRVADDLLVERHELRDDGRVTHERFRARAKLALVVVDGMPVAPAQSIAHRLRAVGVQGARIVRRAGAFENRLHRAPHGRTGCHGAGLRTPSEQPAREHREVRKTGEPHLPLGMVDRDDERVVLEEHRYRVPARVRR